MSRKTSCVVLGIILTTIAGCASSQKAQPEPVIQQVESLEWTLVMNTWDDSDIAILDAPIERIGNYTGQTVDNVPSGSGKFETQSADGTSWYYEGLFENGTFNGEGICVWPDSGYKEEGYYKDGLFLPTKAQFYKNYLRVYSINALKNEINLSDTTISMVSDNEKIFPATTDEDKEFAKQFMDSSIEYKHLSKSVNSYLDKLIYFKNQHVVQVEEIERWGHTVTRILATDDTYTNHHLLFYDGTIDVFDDDSITFVSLPVDSAAFDNIGGGVTNTIASIASIIIKN